jgi:hypothetical protein
MRDNRARSGENGRNLGSLRSKLRSVDLDRAPLEARLDRGKALDQMRPALAPNIKFCGRNI